MTQASRPSGAPVRPNILLIVSDDHGYGDRGYLQHDPAVRTPGLDRLAATGVSCTDAYVTAPICSPSRAAIMSGLYQQRWGATWFGNSGFAPDRETLAEQLAGLGYRTGYFGKVHYGAEQPGDRACPPHHGFEATFYGLAGLQQGRLNYLHHSDDAVQRYGPEASWRMGVQPMLVGDDEVEVEGFLTDEIGRRAREFVAADDDRPFFAMVAFNAVHNFCWQLPEAELRRRGLPSRADWHDADGEYEDWYDGVISPNLDHGREYYLAQLELMDAQILAFQDQLEALGVADDTLVVYLTDNGGSTCNYGDNTPLSGSKYTLGEGGIRVPFLVRWPAAAWADGAVRAGPVSSLDLYPTLLAAAGGTDLPACDGVDLAPLLAGGEIAGRESLHWDCAFQWAVRSGDLKLRWVDGAGPEAEGIRRIEHADPGDGLTLHDLAVDVGEQHDLSAERPGDVERLTALHLAWRTQIGYHVG
ncbi:sulfatase [Occultella glacieicola]|uniref:Sulfatase n=1 Tax=Occultella glacieicola TaxID=2518684 RepID=A0ABY2DYF9_9MICO|nr:sulfatase-like hydrolase/transferase [Occultella glacieicola]TDE89525.1 sulfatase [Occultella glacieicola]